MFQNLIKNTKVTYITDSADWVIKDIGQSLKKEIKEFNLHITTTSFGLRNSTIHYGSIGTFLGKSKIKLPHSSNKIIVTWFHVLPNEDRIDLVHEADKYVNIWHTSSRVTKKKMIALGLTKEKIILIPLGVNFDYFNILNKQNKKDSIGIPSSKIVIGYFQKDGDGWGDGNKPKLIKGPDVFCNVVEKLSQKYEIYILLTGPARGYVKNFLRNKNIPYRHDYLKDSNQVSNYYKACDLYLVTSREEGGPKSILESMACGVPLISTKVGMAEDIIKDGLNGFLVEIEDVDSIYNRACYLIDNQDLRMSLINNALKTVKKYDWSNIGNQYNEKIYKVRLDD